MKPPFATAAVLFAIACAGGGCAMFDRPPGNTATSLESAAAAAAQATPADVRASAQTLAETGPPPRWPASSPSGQASSNPATKSQLDASAAGGKLAGGAIAPGPKTTASTPPADPQALADVLAELAAMGALEPEAQQRLVEDLRATDPALWPGVVQTFRASLAYRRRAAERAQTAGAPATDPPAELTAGERTTPARAAEPAIEDRAVALAATSPDNVRLPQAPTDVLPVAASSEPVASSDLHVPSASQTSPAATPSKAVWQQQLGPAIVELEKQTREPPRDADAIARHVWLRMLYLAAGRRDDALKPIPGIPPAQQDYWSQQIFALATYLDSERIGDSSRRAAEAVQHLTRATASLAEQGPLVVRNLTYCSAVESYGVHKRIQHHEFKPGQELLIYAEVENFKSEETEQGFHTALQPSYQILDSQGHRVAHDELPLTEEHCQNRRRDYFVRYFLTLPKNIYDGTYTLELTIEDTLARKLGQSTIEFTIKQKK